MKKSKLTKFQKWWENKGCFMRQGAAGDAIETSKESWNAAVKHILKSLQYRNRQFEGNWQHEDIDYLIEDLKGMIEK